MAVDNILDIRFNVQARDRISVTNITFVGTLEGFAYLTILILPVLEALLMAVLRRKRKSWANPFGSGLRVNQHGVGVIFEASQSGAFDELSRQCRGEWLLQSARAEADKMPRIQDPSQGLPDEFDYIAMHCNPIRKHAGNEMLSPADFEQQQKMKVEDV